MCLDVIVVELVVGQQVMDDAAQKGDVGAGADRRVIVGDGGRTVEARIDDDELGLAGLLCLDHPLEAAGMRFGGLPPMTKTRSAF